jgi:hypothetical protein
LPHWEKEAFDPSAHVIFKRSNYVASTYTYETNLQSILAFSFLSGIGGANPYLPPFFPLAFALAEYAREDERG